MGKKKFKNAASRTGQAIARTDAIPSEIRTANKSSSSTAVWLPVLLCLLLGLYYWYVYSITDGLYQHDEAAHMIDMLSFWDHPLDTLVGLWSRGGYKILYCLSALGGEPAIVFTNILFTCGTAWFAYKVADNYQLKQSWLVIILFGLQPFVINLSFRCYAEVPTMFFSVLLLFFYQKKKYLWAAVVVSFLFTLRQEMAVFALLLGVFFLLKKKWLPILVLVWAPLTLSILGWLKTGDALYIINSVLQGGVGDTYQRNGFFYLWLMLPEITGAIVVVLFITGYLSFFAGSKDRRKQQLRQFHAVLLLFTIYFLMHCVFTSKSFGFGRSGGLGRFIIVVSPFIAIIAQAGFQYLGNITVKVKQKLIVLGISYLVIIIFLLSVKSVLPLVFNSFTVMILARENFLFLFLAAIIFTMLLLQKSNRRFIHTSFLAVIIFLCAVFTVKPLERGGEDETMKYVTDWYWHSSYAQRPLHTSHIMFTYYSLRSSYKTDHVSGFDSLTVINMKKGELFLYENHYSYRNVSPALLDSSHLSLVKEFNFPGSPFAAYLLEKK